MLGEAHETVSVLVYIQHTLPEKQAIPLRVSGRYLLDQLGLFHGGVAGYLQLLRQFVELRKLLLTQLVGIHTQSILVLFIQS